jgi:hypothetical protein
MASKRLIQNLERAIAGVRKDAAGHNGLMQAFLQGRPGWPAYGKADDAKAAGHEELMSDHLALEAELRPFLCMAYRGESDAAIVAAGYDHDRYAPWR